MSSLSRSVKMKNWILIDIYKLQVSTQQWIHVIYIDRKQTLRSPVYIDSVRQIQMPVGDQLCGNFFSPLDQEECLEQPKKGYNIS